ncbi:MAG: hypothetical protein Q9183_004131 [Haloplaca sp. 2 TL-2023]
MSTPAMFDREQIFDFIILMLYMHYQVPGGPVPNPDWLPIYANISNFFNWSVDKVIDPDRCKQYWVLILKDYFNPDRGTSAWMNNKPAEPWDQNIAPLAAYTDFFKHDNAPTRNQKEQRMAQVQQDFKDFCDSGFGRGRRPLQEIADEQIRLHNEALAEMRQLRGFSQTAIDNWPAEAKKDHFL